ncbi:hypothetical protein [Euzebya tangerina]|uniref:hypothetical protein n=1 Tax=Euzebya tangerina TaxID=591198 RepID=UPI000E31B215|nr:hypothetical protein [Euzebya tangerina]
MRRALAAAITVILVMALALLQDVPAGEEVAPPATGEQPLVAEESAPLPPGVPPPGTVLWGAAVGGNDDPVPRHEAPTGQVLGVRRTFFQWDARATGLVTTAESDLAAGRVPWVSVKTPSWDAMAAGGHDDEIDDLLLALGALDGPVWLTIHHEPEGGGGVNAPDDPAGPDGHVGMNRRVRERLTELEVTNVALVGVFMDWTWDERSGRDIDEWWADGLYDLLGVDTYRRQPGSLLTDNWQRIRTWAQDRDVPIAVGEWGLRGTDQAAGAHVREWFEMAAASHADGAGARVVGLAAFDSGLNSPGGSWELRGAQLEVFHELLADPRAATWSPR